MLIRQVSVLVTTYPPIYLHLIFDILQFEISSLMNWIIFLVWTGLLQATQAVNIQFKLGKIIRYVKLEISS